MNAIAAVWTLWIVNQAAIIPMASYPTETACHAAIQAANTGLQKDYISPLNTALMYCVYGAPVRR